MSKLKVLMVGLLPVDLDSVKGGVVAVIINLFSGFSKLENIEIVHVSFNEEIQSTIEIQYSSNIKIYYLPFKLKFKILDYFFNKRQFNDILIAERPDLIHIQEITPHLIRFISHPKEKIVVTQHGVMREEIKTAIGVRDKLKFLFKCYVEKYVFPLFKNIIFISDYNKALFPDKNVFSEIISNPVNPVFLEVPKLTEVLNSLIYVGVINKRKNLRIVLEALARLNKEGIIFKLNVVGGYKDPAFETEINSIVNKNLLAEQITFHGWQTQEQISKLYEHCDILVLPSQQESVPVSIAEAMMQGKVVVASNVGAISEMFTNNFSGFLFENNSVEGLCNLLRTLYNNSSLIESVSQNARQEAEGKFHPDLIAKKTLEFYHAVIKKSSIY